MQQASSILVRLHARTLVSVLAGIAFTAIWANEAAATSFLRQFALNLDGSVTEAADPFPASVDLSGFDLATGLGMVRIEYSDSPGTHSVLAFFDHDIDAATNTFFNELGGAVGTPITGQSWEVDEPGLVLGDLRDNFEASALDAAVGVSVFGNTIFPDDVATGLGWQFELGAGDTAILLFSVDTTQPTGFHLFHTDPDSDETLYITSSLTVIPEPGTGLLVGFGLLAFAAARRGRTLGRGGPFVRSSA